MSLGVCVGCKRFARANAACPFCGGAIGAPRARGRGRRARNGVLATAALVVACGGTTTGKDASTDAKDDYSAAPPYGAPAYGNVPVDAGKDAPSDATDEPWDGDTALYGAPPPPDGG